MGAHPSISHLRRLFVWSTNTGHTSEYSCLLPRLGSPARRASKTMSMTRRHNTSRDREHHRRSPDWIEGSTLSFSVPRFTHSPHLQPCSYYGRLII